MHEVVATTPTQYAFAICLLLVAPVLAAFAASAQYSRGESPWLGFVLVGGASWAGWILSGVVAVKLFPSYPLDGSPHEAVALLFVLPGLAMGGAVLRWIIKRKPIERPAGRWRRFALLGVVPIATLLAIVFVGRHVRRATWPGRRELPHDAQVLEERIILDDFLGDFSYSLRARMPEASFRRWMRRLDVEATEAPRIYGAPPNQLERPCGSQGSYADGIGVFHAWCS